MRQVLFTLATLALLGLCSAAAIVGFGLYNVSARIGHIPGVAWVLHTTYRNSVRLRSPGTEAVPDTLGNPDLIALGAQHYETACAFCHAAPRQRQSATVASMVPPPPHITEAIAGWDNRHLFRIIRDGVKMSGMPHWPTRKRDDDVWAVVAYLDAVRRDEMLPENKTRDLGNDPDAAAAYCASCHGENGRNGNDFVPRLDILSPDYFRASMMAYRSGERESGIMTQAAALVDETVLDTLITRFAADSADPRTGTFPTSVASAGAALARSGTREIPACTACHGPGATEVSTRIPALAGQSRAYLETQLRLWRDGNRGGSDRAELMAKAAAGLEDEDILALADWYASLTP